MFRDSRIELRIAREDKDRLLQKAADNGFTISTFLFNAAFKNEVPPTKLKESRYRALDKLTMEINRIGNNINQLIPILRGIAADRKIEDGEYRQLLEELRRYNEKRDIIATELHQYMFK